MFDLTPDQVQGLGMEELKPSCRNSCVTPTTSKARSSSSVPVGKFILQQITLWREHLQAWMRFVSPSVYAVMARRIP